MGRFFESEPNESIQPGVKMKEKKLATIFGSVFKNGISFQKENVGIYGNIGRTESSGIELQKFATAWILNGHEIGLWPVTRRQPQDRNDVKRLVAGEDCDVSSECDIAKGLCCKIMRRHRQSPRKVQSSNSVKDLVVISYVSKNIVA